MNYTIIGHSTNLASRLEGINKLYGTRIIISEDTHRRVAGQFFCRLLDFVSVKGQVKSYRIYELVDDLEALISDSVRQFCKTYENGFQSYLLQDWDQAISIFKDLLVDFPQDLSVQLLYQRCVHFKQNPGQLGKDWDGAYHLTEK
jgi:adenylate cyclase